MEVEKETFSRPYVQSEEICCFANNILHHTKQPRFYFSNIDAYDLRKQFLGLEPISHVLVMGVSGHDLQEKKIFDHLQKVGILN